MPIGDNISEPIPAVGTAGTSYASQLVAFLQEVKARLEAKIALTSLLAGLFDLNNSGIANAAYLGLYEQTAAPTTPIGSLQRYGGELYYVSPSGVVRITSGGQLDIVAAAGITGDYAAPAEFRYDLPSLEYQAYSNQADGEWARVAAQGYDIYGTLSSTTRVRLSWGGGSSWTLTLPASPPSTQSILQMDDSGNLVASNVLIDELELPADKDLKLSGTGKVQHGEQKLIIPVLFNHLVTNGTISHSSDNPGAIIPQNTSVYIPLHGLSQHQRLIGFKVNAFDVTGTISYSIMQTNGGGWVATGLANSAGATEVTVANPAIDGQPLDSGFSYYLRVVVPNTSGATVTIDSVILYYNVV